MILVSWRKKWFENFLLWNGRKKWRWGMKMDSIFWHELCAVKHCVGKSNRRKDCSEIVDLMVLVRLLVPDDGTSSFFSTKNIPSNWPTFPTLDIPSLANMLFFLSIFSLLFLFCFSSYVLKAHLGCTCCKRALKNWFLIEGVEGSEWEREGDRRNEWDGEGWAAPSLKTQSLQLLLESPSQDVAQQS